MEIKKGHAIFIIAIFIFFLYTFLEKTPTGLVLKTDKTAESFNTESTEIPKEDISKENKKPKGYWSTELITLADTSIGEYKKFIANFNKIKENGLTEEEGLTLSVELAKLQVAINNLQAENNLTTTHLGIYEEINYYCANMTAFITLVFTVCNNDTGDRTPNQVLKNAETYASQATKNLESISKYSKE